MNKDKRQRRNFIKKIFSIAVTGSFIPGILKTFAARNNWKSLRSPADIAEAEQPYIGEICIVSFEFAPKYWASCNGQILAIATNQALFSLLGTTYGGNGVNTFALPNLRGRSPVHSGSTLGTIGTVSGEENHVLTIQEMPQHFHTCGVSGNYGTDDSPVSLAPARNSSAIPQFTGNYNTFMAPTQAAGVSQAHNNVPPYLALNYIICIQGLYPPRN